MNKCGVNSGYKLVKSCACETKLVNTTHHCSLRTCPRCSKIRKRKIFNKYLPMLEGLHQNRKNFLYFLTISPKNYENLEEGIKHLRKSFTKFLRHQYIQERIKGGFYVIEVKGGKGNWNIHIHAIVYGRYIDNKVRKEKDSHIVRLFQKSSKREVNMHVTRQNSTKFTLNYMLKYVSANKDEFNSPRDIAEYIIYTRKKRLINAFGEFYKIKIEKQKCACNKCKHKIDYYNDPEVIKILEEAEDRPKPPPDLDYWVKRGDN